MGEKAENDTGGLPEYNKTKVQTMNTLTFIKICSVVQEIIMLTTTLIQAKKNVPVIAHILFLIDNKNLQEQTKQMEENAKAE